jgi:cell wall assembly regulator SMI1
MTRPGKSTLYGGWYYVPAGDVYPASPTWTPNANEPAGEYCAITLRANGDGTSTQIGKECINLTS